MEQVSFEHVNSIAILRRNGFGDLLSAMPLLHHCRKMAPQASISLITDQRAAPLLPYLRGFDKAIILSQWPNKYMGGLSSSLKQWGNFDIAISAKPVPMKLLNILLFTMRAKQRVAVVDDAWHSRLINRPIAPSIAGNYQIHQALAVLKMVWTECSSIPVEYYPKLHLPQSYLEGEHVLKVRTFRKDNIPTLLVSVTNNRAHSFLGIERYAEILNAVHKQHPIHVVISCEPHNHPEAAALARLLTPASLPFPTHNLASFLSLLNAVDAVFVGDGGIMHMAAGLDKPQVVLFGKTRVQQWAPLSELTTCLSHPDDVKEIHKEEIIRALLNTLKR